MPHFSVFFQIDVSLSEGKSTFSVAEVVDSNNPTAGETAAAAGLARMPAGHPLGFWLFFLPPSPIRLNEMELFVGLEVAMIQPAPSPGAKGLKLEKTLTEHLCTFQLPHKQPEKQLKL